MLDGSGGGGVKETLLLLVKVTYGLSVRALHCGRICKHASLCGQLLDQVSPFSRDRLLIWRKALCWDVGTARTAFFSP